jgi:DNA-binding beta-propeller fold protein YncE
MHRYIMRVFVAAAASVALSTVGVTGASVSSAASRPVRASSAGPSHTAASPGAQLWLKRYNGTGNGVNQARSAAISPSGKTVYVTGNSDDASDTSDYATVAYSAATGGQLWVKHYTGVDGGGGQANSVAVSPSGSTVFVTGFTYGTTTHDYADYATIAYSAASGAQLWIKTYHGSALGGSNEAYSLAVSPTGKAVFVTGLTYNSGSPYYATIAYSAATGAQLWIKIYHGSGNEGFNVEGGYSVAVSPTGKTVFVTGQGTTADQPDYATVAYNAVTGVQLWAKLYRHSGSSNCTASSVAISPTGKTVIVTGYYEAASSAGYATVAYNAVTGAQLWVKLYSPLGGSDDAYSVAVSPSGKTVFVTGGVYGGGGEGDEDYATVAYSAATGAQLWAKRYNLNGGTNIAYSVAVSPSGSTVYVTGGSEYGYATIAYNAATGAQLWLKRYNGTLNYENTPPEALSVAVSPTTGTVFVTGGIRTDTSPSYAYTTIAYSG